jgi:hypothetical protein
MKNAGKKHDYQLARDLVIRHIADGGYQPGDKLPGRPKLAETLKIGLISVQQAVKTLEKDGVLYNIKGSGCYLKRIPSPGAPPSPGPEQNSSFDAEMLFGRSSGSGKLTIKLGVFPGELHYFGEEWKKVTADFERKNHGLTVETVPVGEMGELKEKLSRAELDVFQLPLSRLALMIKSGLVMNPGPNLGLEAESFFTPVYKAACHGGETPWGAPMAVSCCCMFHRTKHAAPRGDGFWDFLGRLWRTPPQSGLEAHIANNHVLDELFRLAVPGLRPDEMDSDKILGHPEFEPFVTKLDKYYRNPKIFHPHIKEASEDSIRALAAGRCALAFGSSSWLPLFQRAQVKNLSLSEEPREAGAASKNSSVICMLSSLSCHTEECLSLLRHIGLYETQTVFARKGMPTANKHACASLESDVFTSADKDRLLSIFETGTAPVFETENADMFLAKVLRPESVRWRSGKLTTEQFLENMQRKRKLILGQNRGLNIAV